MELGARRAAAQRGNQPVGNNGLEQPVVVAGQVNAVVGRVDLQVKLGTGFQQLVARKGQQGGLFVATIGTGQSGIIGNGLEGRKSKNGIDSRM